MAEQERKVPKKENFNRTDLGNREELRVDSLCQDNIGVAPETPIIY
jgi:hypothetical protein